MNQTLLTCCLLPVFLSPLATAGINGTYKVKGTETENGKKYAFTGTVKISNYKNGKYTLKFADGEVTAFTFKFNKPLKDLSPAQTVSGSSSLGTGNATFKLAKGKYTVTFDYKAKGADVKGSGTGSK
ncbi:MAG: hypothetical protein EOP88_18040 [Verrucomicrobiaceae bacterium]|nr:MAG: hypothetical protein EOP88_18040 [Verrucomicrobiaceae bacterium]